MLQESSDRASLPVAGIDVAKDQLEVFIDTVHHRQRLANDPQGIQQLLTLFQQHPVRLIVLEATGRYHLAAAASLLAAGLKVATVNPQQARAFARAAGKLEKTDRIDAALLAGLGRALAPRRDQAVAAHRQVLADLLGRRSALVGMRVAETNRSHEAMPQLALTQSKKLLRLLDRQIQDLDRHIAQLIESDDDWRDRSRIIDSVPGLGSQTAHQVTVQLPELGCVNRRQVSKLAGLAPLNCDSGRYRGQRKIRGGRQNVRSALYMAAFNVRQRCPHFKRYFEGLLARGKSYQVAMTALMRKLLITLNQMAKTHTCWNEKLHGEIA